MIIRDCTPDDLEPMRAIYGHHAVHGLGTFEEAAPEPEDFAGRVAGVLNVGLPWLVAEADKRIVGYGYASPYRPRIGYRFTCEDSVYIAPDRMGQGIGRSLLAEVIERSTAKGLRVMFAHIGDSANQASVGLHRSLGFEICGVQRPGGFKHGRWVDVVVMQRHLGDGDQTPPSGDGWWSRA